MTTNQVLQRLIEEYVKEQKQMQPSEVPSDALEKKEGKPSHKNAQGIIVKGHDNMLVRLAHCCNPVPGDRIIGFITRGRGVSVHRADCSNLSSLSAEDANRLIEVEWAQAEREGYLADVRIITLDKNGIFAELSRIISNMGLPIMGVNAKPARAGTFTVDFSILIKDTEQLDSVINSFRRVPEVLEVYRGSA